MSENPVTGPTARRLLGLPGPPIGRSRFAALKRATGQTGRYVFVSMIQKFLRDHPNFSERDIYPRKRLSSADQPHQKQAEE